MLRPFLAAERAPFRAAGSFPLIFRCHPSHHGAMSDAARSGSLDAALAQGERLLGRDPDAALAQAREILKVNAGQRDALWLAGAALRATGRAAEAAALEQAAIDASGRDAALVHAGAAITAGRVRAWFNRVDYRRWYLAVGFALHLGVWLTMEVGAFLGAVLSLYACCVHPDEFRALGARLTRRRGAASAPTP